MDLRISEKKFICVDYPAIVQNHEAMLQTLGGTAKVTEVTWWICLLLHVSKVSVSTPLAHQNIPTTRSSTSTPISFL